MTTWLTSDQHFDHANIIKYTDRPFVDTQHMNIELIGEWNAVVSPDDTIYHLGDFTLGNRDTAYRFFSLLNGHIHILGNPWHHDSRWLSPGPFEFGSYAYIEPPIVVLEKVEKSDDGWSIPAVLCHYPFLTWDRMHYGSYHFFGHSHGASEKRPNCLDVGVDNIYKLTGHYRPIRLEDAIKFAKNS